MPILLFENILVHYLTILYNNRQKPGFFGKKSGKIENYLA